MFGLSAGEKIWTISEAAIRNLDGRMDRHLSTTKTSLIMHRVARVNLPSTLLRPQGLSVTTNGSRSQSAFARKDNEP